MVIKKNKKGWLRIVEASIAALIIMAMLIGYNLKIREKEDPTVSNNLAKILEEVARDNILRERILEYNVSLGSSNSANLGIISEINSSIEDKFEGYRFRVQICDVGNAACPMEEFPANFEGDIFSSSRIISSSPASIGFSPRIVKVYVWDVK